MVCYLSNERVYLFQDFLGKSDPYLVISKELPDGSKVVVHKTEVLSLSNFLLMADGRILEFFYGGLKYSVVFLPCLYLKKLCTDFRNL